MEPDFELGEDVRSDSRLQQDAKWAEANIDARLNFSNRESSIVYSKELRAAIEYYHVIVMLHKALSSGRSHISKLGPELLRHIVDYAIAGQGLLVTTLENYRKCQNTERNQTPFKICVRKRPVLSFEREYGAYDIAYIPKNSNEIILHDGRLARNGRRLIMTHRKYRFDKIWDENTDNRQVCSFVIEPLLSWIEKGMSATLLCYGQTGTGKTYTLLGALDYISYRVLKKHLEVSNKYSNDYVSNIFLLLSI